MGLEFNMEKPDCVQIFADTTKACKLPTSLLKAT
jgi:hypothetical protein